MAKRSSRVVGPAALREPETRLTRAIDRVVETISPSRGVRRRALRQLSKEFGRFSAPTRDRSRVSGPWSGASLSADAALLPRLEDLRARSHELVSDNGLAAALVQTETDNIIGTGIRVQSRPDIDALGISTEAVENFTTVAERAWRRWSRHCDAGRRLDVMGMQELICRQVIEDGEAFVVRHMLTDPRRPYRLAFSIVDPDRIQSPNGVDQINTRSGIVLDEHFGPTAYWLRVAHPSDDVYGSPKFKWREIPARDEDGTPNVLHIYIPKRPDQTRGAPLLAPVLNLFRDLEKLQEATIVRERIAACFSAMISTLDPEVASMHAASEVRTGPLGRSERIEDLYPGLIGYLEPGQSVTFGTPTGLAQPYAELVKGIVTQLAAACGIPYVLLSKDFSQLNFSSARAALLEARRLFRRMQSLIISQALTPMWELLLEEAFLRGEFGAIDFDGDREAWTRATWVTPGWGWVDPVKEVDAAQKAIEAGLSTAAEECAALGRDFEEVYDQLAREQTKREELGITVGSEKQSAPAAAPVAESRDTEMEDPEDEQ